MKALHSPYRSVILCLIVSLQITGCMVGPDYRVQDAANATVFKEIQGWQPAQPNDLAPKGNWWEAYQDPTLNQLIAQVNINNQNILAVEAQYRQALALVQSARASLFPSVSASANESRSATSTNSAVNNFYSTGLNASWEPDLWGGIRRNIEASRASAQSNAALLEAAALSARATLAQSYFQLRIIEMQQRMYDDTIMAYQKSLTITKNQYAAGIASQLDVNQAQATLQATQALAIDLGITRAQLEHAIAVLLGQAPANFSLSPQAIATDPQTGLLVSPASRLLAHLPSVPVGIPAELLERRPDIASAERLMAAANAKIGVAQAAFYPNITLSGSGAYQSTMLPGLIGAPNQIWSVGPSITLPLFDAGLRSANLTQAKAFFDQSVANYRQTVLSAFQAVEDNLVALRLLENETRIQEQAVLSARNATRIALNQYQSGIVNYTTVVTAQITQLNNERTLMGLLSRRLVAHVGLHAALGGGWNLAADPKIQSIRSPKK